MFLLLLKIVIACLVLLPAFLCLAWLLKKQNNKKTKPVTSSVVGTVTPNVKILESSLPYHCCCKAVLSGIVNQRYFKLLRVQRDLNLTQRQTLNGLIQSY